MEGSRSSFFLYYEVNRCFYVGLCYVVLYVHTYIRSTVSVGSMSYARSHVPVRRMNHAGDQDFKYYRKIPDFS